jgi:hypothetical protein
VGISVKAFIKLCNKLGPSNIPLACIFRPLPPLPVFRIQIENNITKFGQLISNAMQRKIMLHLGDPAHGIKAIKFIDLNSGKTRATMKGVGLKGHSMGGVNTIYLGGLFKEGGGLGSIQQLVESGIEGVKFAL